MAGRGVHFALSTEDEQRLIAAGGTDEVLEIVFDDLAERPNDGWRRETDLAWNAIHRCLGDGSLTTEPRSVRHRAILGGRPLHRSRGYRVTYLSAPEVSEVAASLADIDEAWMRQRYFAIDEAAYGEPLTEEDFEYVWGWFQPLQAFFARAATARRAIAFTAR